jgi:hypothetical protein
LRRRLQRHAMPFIQSLSRRTGQALHPQRS